ncbi:hypothetical protein AB5I41_13390 [Sphingomonas sp. MMS24-JH45]
MTVNSDSVVTSGSGSGAGIVGSSDGALGITSRNVTTSGDGAYAIATVGGSGGTTITSSGTITTSGGTRLGGGNRPAQEAYGIWATATGGAVTITSNAIATAGSNASAIFVEAQRGNRLLDGSLPALQPIAITSTGAISTGGNAAYGISVSAGGSDTHVVNSDTITTVGGASDAIGVLGAGAAIVENGGSIATRGEFARGIVVSDFADATVRSNAIAATGSNATGIDVSTGGAIDIASTRIAATNTGITARGGLIRIDSGQIDAGVRGIDLAFGHFLRHRPQRDDQPRRHRGQHRHVRRDRRARRRHDHDRQRHDRHQRRTAPASMRR